jgi:hypothetical protein
MSAAKTAVVVAVAVVLAGCGDQKFDAKHQCSPLIAGLCGKVGAPPVGADKCARVVEYRNAKYCILKPSRGSSLVKGAGP